MLKLVEWLTFVTTLPTRNTTARMRLWRAVKALGAATLRDGVYLLPLRESINESLQTLAADVRTSDGSAEILQVAADEAQDKIFRALFNRTGDYAALIAATRAEVQDEKLLRRLTREFEALKAIDYFPDEAREQAQSALTALTARISPGEPSTVCGQIRRLANTDYAGRIWATRQRIWVDRIASAWLIRRFIDPHGKFIWLKTPADCPADALGFDFDGATFTHIDGRVTFEVLAVSFGLQDDPAIARIGTIVHCLDAGGIPVMEAPGVEAVLAGLRAAEPDDNKLLSDAAHIFDGLYMNYQQDKPHE
ncbi:MAG: chromate resistance protein [Proteobacteria bacterium]|nr:chromate resistance protein [Pseudomonadota bacterium]